jgi:hypothetical protein
MALLASQIAMFAGRERCALHPRGLVRPGQKRVDPPCTDTFNQLSEPAMCTRIGAVASPNDASTRELPRKSHGNRAATGSLTLSH